MLDHNRVSELCMPCRQTQPLQKPIKYKPPLLHFNFNFQ